MSIAFYAPLKPPTHAVPSGDRSIARLLMRALAAAGYRVRLASRLRSWEGGGDVARQRLIRARGRRLAAGLIERYRSQPAPARPALWFTYHLYHKAPDWLGPEVSHALGIPYVVAEASYAPKQGNGCWRAGQAAVKAAIQHADAIFALNGGDVPCLLPLLDDASRVVRLKPFLDAGAYRAAADRDAARARLARRYALDREAPWMLVVAMMRPGRKLTCYRLLAAALERLLHRRWNLLVVGDGAARREVEVAFGAGAGARTVFAGVQARAGLHAFYAAADLFVWPAVGEPLGMALLEAQASGLAVVAGDARGVPEIVRHRQSGLLAPAGDTAAYAAAVESLLANPARRREMGAAAGAVVAREHDIAAAAGVLADTCGRLMSWHG